MLIGRTAPTASVLVLPGGTDQSYKPFSRTQPAALRMYPFTLSLAALPGVVVRQAQYRVYGWNGEQNSPMPCAQAALTELLEAHPDVPVIVIGHSMGGRVAAQLAADKRVAGVLALAPWWQHADWRHINDDARVLALHGTADTRTYARRTAKGIRELRERGVDAEFVAIEGGGHALLDHLWTWQSTAVRFVRSFR
ncbi:alpha/beta fold hydrolase [Nocardia sp. 348MFTsu5.1]|uniref:alpha/beta fold hydrolase n=1 Tax=Nocardia sp. 348MFTsu5.1 TaxID=1172185 RepID=UPI000365A684|nr:alpha/beta fold hydrolase [Nocardia sp. 348MFTsu5.1]